MRRKRPPEKKGALLNLRRARAANGRASDETHDVDERGNQEQWHTDLSQKAANPPREFRTARGIAAVAGGREEASSRRHARPDPAFIGSL